MLLDISHDDVVQAWRDFHPASRCATWNRQHHNWCNPIVYAIERQNRGCHAVTTDEFLHISGPSLPNKIVRLSKPAKYYLERFVQGVAGPVERMQIT